MIGTLEKQKEETVRHHTVRGPVKLSSGMKAEEYIDLRSAMFCPVCRTKLLMWYQDRIASIMNYEGFYTAYLVSTGAFGAALLSHLSGAHLYGVLWNPKDHGLEWSPAVSSSGWPTSINPVILLDDVATTGNTLGAMREAVEDFDLPIIGEIIAVDNRKEEHAATQ